jgi:DNA-binding NarL/FixJ family response regulator
VNAVRTVAAGRRYLTAEVAERLADDLRRSTDRELHEALSDREFEVMTLLAAGNRVRQIATELRLSYNTISTYRARVLTKLGLTTDADVIRYAIRHSLVH